MLRPLKTRILKPVFTKAPGLGLFIIGMAAFMMGFSMLLFRAPETKAEWLHQVLQIQNMDAQQYTFMLQHVMRLDPYNPKYWDLSARNDDRQGNLEQAAASRDIANSLRQDKAGEYSP
jgi:hypothetical protein